MELQGAVIEIIYKNELNRFVQENKITMEEIPFKEILDPVEPISKAYIPDTSLMWEFVHKQIYKNIHNFYGYFLFTKQIYYDTIS